MLGNWLNRLRKEFKLWSWAARQDVRVFTDPYTILGGQPKPETIRRLRR